MADPGISKPGGVVPVRETSWDLTFVLMPLQTYPMFCSERREQSTYCKHCMMAAIKVYGILRVIQSNFTNTNPPKNSNRGMRAGTPVLDPPLLVTLGNRDIKLNVSTEGIPFLPKSMERILSEKKGQCHHYRLITN